MKRYVICFLLFVCIKVHGQNQSYDFYAFRLSNMFNVNPAYCTQDSGVNIIMNAQSLTQGVSFANKNVMGGVYSKIGNQQGVGAKLISDTRGAFQSLKADLSYGYLAKLNDFHSLSLGLSAGIINSNLNTNRIQNFEVLDLTDPTLTDPSFNATKFTAGGGLLYSYKTLDVSVSFPHILTSSQPFNGYANAAVFYEHVINDKLSVQPWVSYQSLPVTKSVSAFYLKGVYKNLFWLQAGYGSNKSFAGAFGTTLDNIGISYGYRLSNPEFRQVANGVHEIVLRIRLGVNSDKVKSSKKITNLDDIISSIDRLLSKTITAENKSQVREELEKVKVQLRNAEIDNSDPENAKKVEQQLIIIDEKLKMLENKLSNE